MNPAEKKLHQILISLTKNFSYNDSIEYRKERNWLKHDSYNQIEKLNSIIREVKEFKNGYFDDDFSEENDINEEY